MENDTYLVPTWQLYIQNAQILAEKVLQNQIRPDEIVAIARGGLTLGHILSDLLQIPIQTIGIQSYTDINQQGNLTITSNLAASSIAGKNILLVDDVADSGKTFIKAMEYLNELKPSSITTTAMYIKPHSTFKPDYFVYITTKWIIFPYEQTETIILLWKKMEKEGKQEADIVQFLLSLGWNDQQIQFTKTYHLQS